MIDTGTAFIRHEQEEQSDPHRTLPRTTAQELMHAAAQLLDNGYPQRGADGGVQQGYWQLHGQPSMVEPRMVAIDCEMVCMLWRRS